MRFSIKFLDQFLLIFDRFGSHFGSQDGAKIDKKRCWKNDEKTMTTKMAKKSNTGAYDTVGPDDFGARGGGRRRGKPLLQGSWRKLEGRVGWMMEGSWKIELSG